MDPITQGALGAITAQALGPKALGRHNLWIGWLAGMAADLDVLIRSDTDPLIAIEYHRHFTHALLFVPVGALLVAAPLWLLLARWRERFGFGAVYLSALLAYLSHAPLDACTSYGTLLLWPFSDRRIAWDWLPVVDPIVTVGLLVGIGAAARKGTRRGAIAALAFFLVYTAIACLLHARALAGVRTLAALRGEPAAMARAMPKLPTILAWRGIYRTEGEWVTDSFRVVPGLPTEWVPGGRRPVGRDLAATASEKVADALRRFGWFAQGYLAPVSRADGPLVAGVTADQRAPHGGAVDLRYGPGAAVTGLWALVWDDPSGRGLRRVGIPMGSIGDELDWVWAMVRGSAPGLRALPSGDG